MSTRYDLEKLKRAESWAKLKSKRGLEIKGWKYQKGGVVDGVECGNSARDEMKRKRTNAAMQQDDGTVSKIRVCLPR